MHLEQKCFLTHLLQLMVGHFCSCSAEGERWIRVVETHEIPEILGGQGGGLVLCFPGARDSPHEAVTQLVTRILLRVQTLLLIVQPVIPLTSSNNFHALRAYFSI